MIAVTGAAGFIGSCFIRTLNDKGINDALIIDTFGKDERWKNLAGKRFHSIMEPQDFRAKCSDSFFKNGDITAIVHLGACTSTTERDADYLLDVNYRYSIDIARFALEKNIPFIYASSAATYGDGQAGYSDDLCYGLQPLNMYGYSKQLFDEWLLNTGYLNSCTGIKFFNVFGPNEYHKNDMASMVYKAWQQIRNTGKIRLFASSVPEYPDGGQMRDFIYVKDACAVLWNLIENPGTLNGLLNLGTGIARSWNELAIAVFTAMNLDPSIEYIPMPESLSKQYQNFTQADMSRLKGSDAWVDFMPLEDSIYDYVCMHLQNSRSIFY
jgi:ADP-L-glycero-D-manno-heptose 6-epimerase